MTDAASLAAGTAARFEDRMTRERKEDQDVRLADVVTREQSRLRRFIARRVPDPRDAEDILQEVFYELVHANRRLMPIDHVTGWLFRVARNRITDLFRRARHEPLEAAAPAGAPESLLVEDLLAAPGPGPEAEYARRRLVEALEAAVAALPKDQRDVFIAHEIEGRSFKAIADETGVSVNTLLSRKHYAVRRLRARLRPAYDDGRFRR